MALTIEQTLATALSNPRAALDQLDKYECEESLAKFMRAAWRYMDPSPLIWGWHLDAICEHLEAVATGEMRRLLINVPPRTSKSTACSVAFPAWVWARRQVGYISGPQTQFLTASYAQVLSLRDAVKTRRLIQSSWYQGQWGSRFQLAGDQNTKSRYDNDKGGYRIATSVGGSITGEGASCIIIDDAANATESASEATIASTIDWWDTAMSTRLNDPKVGAYIVIMQRLHDQDLAGHILANSPGEWTHLNLPMRYESGRHCITSIGWSDPRNTEGELLCPDRFGETEVDRLERALGPYQASGQLQQSPQPKGGGIFKRDWWQAWKGKTYPKFDFVLASLDTAYTTKQENDYSALTLWGVFRDEYDHPKIMLMYGWHDRLEINDLVTRVAETCHEWKCDHLLIEAKASGISVAQELRRLYARQDFGIQLLDPKGGDKVARAYSVQHLFSEGLVYVPHKKQPESQDTWAPPKWAETILKEAESFPKGKHDDFVDSAVQALKHLRSIGLAELVSEYKARDYEETVHKPRKNSVPLYAV